MNAAQALQQARAILNMDSNPARYRWMCGLIEADFVCRRRRREWLESAGQSTHYAARDWDKLPEKVRAALGVV